MWIGALFALAAGLLWGIVFIVPTLLPQYPAVMLAVGRHLAFGLIALPLAFFSRRALRQLSANDWWQAAKLTLIGNFLYYSLLAAAIQRSGTPLVSMIIGTLPVVIAIFSNQRNAARDGHFPWGKIAPALALMVAGILAVNYAETARLVNVASADRSDQSNRYAWGALLAVGAVACWTWYPIRNADWLRAHGDRSTQAWATAQGLVTLPLAVLGYAGFWAAVQWGWISDVEASFMPWGDTPLRYIGLMLTIGLLSSWLGGTCWNEASQRLPTTLAGQLIVFETLSALLYAFILRQEWPDALTLGGMTALVLGVMWALRVKPQPAQV